MVRINPVALPHLSGERKIQCGQSSEEISLK